MIDSLPSKTKVPNTIAICYWVLFSPEIKYGENQAVDIARSYNLRRVDGIYYIRRLERLMLNLVSGKARPTDALDKIKVPIVEDTSRDCRCI